MKPQNIRPIPKIECALDKDFRPASLENRAFLKAVEESKEGVPLAIALERGDGLVSAYHTKVFPENSPNSRLNYLYAERLVKTLLWVRGGWKITIGGPASIGNYIKKAYSDGGIREFDSKFMGKVYEKPFMVEVIEYDKVPAEK